MNKRLTNERKECECRVSHCRMESYLSLSIGLSIDEINKLGMKMCENCPCIHIANELAKYEDIYGGGI